MIKISVENIFNSVPVLKELAEKPFKGAMTFKIVRLIRELDKEIASFEEARNKIADTYAERDENGNYVIVDNSIKIQEDKIQQCNEELISLMNTIVEINAEKIPAFALNDIDISPSQAMAIEELIEY